MRTARVKYFCLLVLKVRNKPSLSDPVRKSDASTVDGSGAEVSPSGEDATSSAVEEQGLSKLPDETMTVATHHAPVHISHKTIDKPFSVVATKHAKNNPPRRAGKVKKMMECDMVENLDLQNEWSLHPSVGHVDEPMVRMSATTDDMIHEKYYSESNPHQRLLAEVAPPSQDRKKRVRMTRSQMTTRKYLSAITPPHYEKENATYVNEAEQTLSTFSKVRNKIKRDDPYAV